MTLWILFLIVALIALAIAYFAPIGLRGRQFVKVISVIFFILTIAFFLIWITAGATVVAT